MQSDVITISVQRVDVIYALALSTIYEARDFAVALPLCYRVLHAQPGGDPLTARHVVMDSRMFRPHDVPRLAPRLEGWRVMLV